jgi:hypothetical protein
MNKPQTTRVVLHDIKSYLDGVILPSGASGIIYRASLPEYVHYPNEDLFVFVEDIPSNSGLTALPFISFRTREDAPAKVGDSRAVYLLGIYVRGGDLRLNAYAEAIATIGVAAGEPGAVGQSKVA